MVQNTDELTAGPNDDDGPTPEDLAAIEAEMPLIKAEIALVDAERRVLTVRRLSDLDWRRVRRAEAAVMREAMALAAHISLSDLTAWPTWHGWEIFAHGTEPVGESAALDEQTRAGLASLTVPPDRVYRDEIA